MVESAVKPSLQKHEKDLKNLEGKMEQLQESLTRSFEQTAQIGAMESQISQLNRKLLITSKVIAQKVMKAIEASRQTEKEKVTAAEVNLPVSTALSSFTVLDMPPPRSPITNPLPQLQFGMATSLITSTSIPVSVVGQAARPGGSNLSPHSTYSPSYINSHAEPVIRPMARSVPFPINPRSHSPTAHMVNWHSYSDPVSNMGLVISQVTTPTPAYMSIGPQNYLPLTSQPVIIQCPNYHHMNYPIQTSPPAPSSNFPGSAYSPYTTPIQNSQHYMPHLTGIVPYFPTSEGRQHRQPPTPFLPFPMPKMDFPHFDGRDTSGWLKNCEKFFQLNPMLDIRSKLMYDALYLEGEADMWYQSMLAHNKGCTEDYFIESFLSGLKEEIANALYIVRPNLLKML